MVNGQPCMPNWAACFRHRGTYVKLIGTTSYIHQRLQKSKNAGSIEHQSVAAISHEGKSLKRQKFVRMLSQECFGRPTRLRPQGVQWKTRLSHRWSGSNARQWAKFQSYRKHISDQGLHLSCSINLWMRPFHWCRILRHGSVQSMLPRPCPRHHLPHPSISRIVDTCKVSRASYPKYFVHDPYLDVPPVPYQNRSQPTVRR